MKILSKSLQDTEKTAKEFLEKISRSLGRPQGKAALVVGLFGDLGSGKTTFVQILGRDLDIKEVMTSPTFVLEKIYLLNGEKGFKKLIHIDAYRLESGKELLNLGIEEILKDPGNLILIEWPERVADVLPKDLLKVSFKFIKEFEREITF